MKKIWHILGNKYMLTVIAFGVWMLYFDQNDLFTMWQKQKELHTGKMNIVFMNREIAQMEKEQTDLLTNRQKLEQYARENFRMKKDNEDLYVIERK